MTLSSGSATTAREMQWKPALHGPVGASRPSVAQNEPATHALHCAAAVSMVELLNVPAGHGNEKAEGVEKGHQKPGRQRAGVTVPTVSA